LYGTLNINYYAKGVITLKKYLYIFIFTFSFLLGKLLTIENIKADDNKPVDRYLELIEMSREFYEPKAIYLTPPYFGRLLFLGGWDFADHDRRYSISPNDNSISYWELFEYSPENPWINVSGRIDPKHPVTSILMSYHEATQNLEKRPDDFIPPAPWFPGEFAGYADGWYFYTRFISGAGSGETYRLGCDTLRLYAINPDIYAVDPDEGYKDFGDFRGAHTRVYNERLYYLDMSYLKSAYYGSGRLWSMDFNGNDKQLVVDDLFHGEFHIINDIIYYMQAEEYILYSINLDGTGKTEIFNVYETFKQELNERWFERIQEIDIVFIGNFLIFSTYGVETKYIMELCGSNIVRIPGYLFVSPFNWHDNAVFFKARDGYWIYRVK